MEKGRKTGSKSQKKQPKSNPDIDSTSNPPRCEITAYFLSSGEKYVLQDNNSARLPEVPVPSPDDAALPNSSLCSTDNPQLEGTESNKSNRDCVKPVKQDGQKQPTKECDKVLTGDASNLIRGKNLCSTKKKTKCGQLTPNGSRLLVKLTPCDSNRPGKSDSEKKEKLLTDYFPVRRSNRKPFWDVIEKRKQFEEAIFSGNEEGFEIKQFGVKGRGIITNKTFKRGDFVLEYYGELINIDEAKKREKLYAAESDVGCYMYYFKYNNKQYCIDSTKESGRLGRLVNHSKKGNLRTQPFFIEETPHLIFIACRDIFPGDELSYDYGDRSKRSLESHPWLAS